MDSPPSLSSSLLQSIVFFLAVQTLTTSAIPLGSTLTTSTTSSSSWSSSNQTFAVAFVPFPGDPSLYLAAITYSGGVPVWTAGGPSAAVDSGASLGLLADGNLRLANASGAVVWQSSTSDLGVSSATLHESGELILSNSSSVVWSSFSDPFDTILQSQNLTFGKTLNSGLYNLAITATGNLTLQWSSTVTFFNNGLNSSFSGNTTLNSPTLVLQSNGILSLSDGSLPSSVSIAYSSDYGQTGSMVRFLRLDGDGNLRIYSSVSGSGVATAVWSAISDQCQVFGYCGNNGVCTYNDTSPVCGCPSENFVPVDSGDPRRGCRRTTDLQSCPGNSTMLQLDNTLYLTYPPELDAEEYRVGITACRQFCLSGSSCVASTALADGSGHCYIKVSNFVSGYRSPAIPSTSFVKVCPPAIPNPPPSEPNQSGGGDNDGDDSSGRLSGGAVAGIVVGSVVALIAIEAGLWWFFFRNGSMSWRRRSPSSEAAAQHPLLLEYASGAPVQFSYRELQSVTDGFKEMLGSGGFGAVYRGNLAGAGNKTAVAVKQLEGIEQGEKQFRMEVAAISSTHHLNLVRLIGFCSEGRHRLLVYEFMKNGSLDGFLFFSGDGEDRRPPKRMPWEARFGIAVGTARGIAYLHEECRDCIVHCDIKPENILVDDNLVAKVSDFGLARLISGGKDHRHRSLSSVRGTRGYLPPEWLANLPITTKSDVYSFGMVLLEMVSGRRNFDTIVISGDGERRRKFSNWAYEEMEKGNLMGIVDGRMLLPEEEEEVDMEQIERAIRVSFWCVQEMPAMRPAMGKVVQMLEGVVEVGMPPPPAGDLPATDGRAAAFSTIPVSSSPSPAESSAMTAAAAAAADNGEKKNAGE